EEEQVACLLSGRHVGSKLSSVYSFVLEYALFFIIVHLPPKHMLLPLLPLSYLPDEHHFPTRRSYDLEEEHVACLLSGRQVGSKLSTVYSFVLEYALFF